MFTLLGDKSTCVFKYAESSLTLLEDGDCDFKRLQFLSVQLLLGPDLSCGSVDLQPALRVTVQLKAAHKHTIIMMKLQPEGQWWT